MQWLVLEFLTPTLTLTQPIYVPTATVRMIMAIFYN